MKKKLEFKGKYDILDVAKVVLETTKEKMTLKKLNFIIYYVYVDDVINQDVDLLDDNIFVPNVEYPTNIKMLNTFGVNGNKIVSIDDLKCVECRPLSSKYKKNIKNVINNVIGNINEEQLYKFYEQDLQVFIVNSYNHDKYRLRNTPLSILEIKTYYNTINIINSKVQKLNELFELLGEDTNKKELLN